MNFIVTVVLMSDSNELNDSSSGFPMEESAEANVNMLNASSALPSAGASTTKSKAPGKGKTNNHDHFFVS